MPDSGWLEEVKLVLPLLLSSSSLLPDPPPDENLDFLLPKLLL